MKPFFDSTIVYANEIIHWMEMQVMPTSLKYNVTTLRPPLSF